MHSDRFPECSKQKKALSLSFIIRKKRERLLLVFMSFVLLILLGTVPAGAQTHCVFLSPDDDPGNLAVAKVVFDTLTSMNYVVSIEGNPETKIYLQPEARIFLKSFDTPPETISLSMTPENGGGLYESSRSLAQNILNEYTTASRGAVQNAASLPDLTDTIPCAAVSPIYMKNIYGPLNLSDPGDAAWAGYIIANGINTYFSYADALSTYTGWEKDRVEVSIEDMFPDGLRAGSQPNRADVVQAMPEADVESMEQADEPARDTQQTPVTEQPQAPAQDAQISGPAQEENTMNAPITDTPAEEIRIAEPDGITPAADQDASSQNQSQGELQPSAGSSETQDTAPAGNDDQARARLEQVITTAYYMLPQTGGDYAIYLCDLKNQLSGYAPPASNRPMKAASLIKLYIMGAVYENYDALTAAYGKDVIDGKLRPMITISDNDAANSLVTMLGSGDSTAGRQIVNTFCQSHGYVNSSMGRMLLESNANGDNYTSVKDCGQFLVDLYTSVASGGAAASVPDQGGSLWSSPQTQTILPHAQEMYDLLKAQERKNKIPANLPAGAKVANKTGELDDVENDAGILYDMAGGNDLVLVFMSENVPDVGNAQRGIANASRFVYDSYQ